MAKVILFSISVWLEQKERRYLSFQHVVLTRSLTTFIFKYVFFFLLQLVMYQIPFARVACLVQRTMGAADVNRSYSSFFEEKACANMENVCIPAHPGTTDTEPRIWTDVQVSSWLLSTLFYCLCNLGGVKSWKFWLSMFLIYYRNSLSLNFKNEWGGIRTL